MSRHPSSSETQLRDMTWNTVRMASFEVAILPWGATEAHNYHLPFGTDTIQVEAIAAEAADKAVQNGASVVVLPAVPFGVHTQQRDLPLTINMNPSTQVAVLSDIIQSLEDAGIGKLLVLNGHGGNDFKQMIRELQAETSVFLCAANWWTMISALDYFEHVGDHAGELETSVMMHYEPDLVRPLSEAGPGTDRRFKIDALRDKSVWAPRQWTQVTEDTGVGDPYKSTASKGASFALAVTDKLAKFLIDLSASDPNDMYE
jgi:creatinine amidohydrolase